MHREDSSRSKRLSPQKQPKSKEMHKESRSDSFPASQRSQTLESWLSPLWAHTNAHQCANRVPADSAASHSAAEALFHMCVETGNSYNSSLRGPTPHKSINTAHGRSQRFWHSSSQVREWLLNLSCPLIHKSSVSRDHNPLLPWMSLCFCFFTMNAESWREQAWGKHRDMPGRGL